MTTAFCDTSVLIRYFAEDDVPRALAAARLIDGDTQLVVSSAVILETVHTLRSAFGLDHPVLADVLIRFLSRSNVRVSDAEKVGLIAALISSRRASARRIADAVVAAAATAAGVDFIATFDEKLTSPTVPIRLI